MRTFPSVVITLTLVLTSLQAQAENNILFIIDGSNSMWGQIDGEAKISSAQNVLGGLIKDLPADTQISLMSYGHRKKSSCDDIEVLSEVGQSNTNELIGKINALQPKGKTPIAGALQKSLNVLSKFEADNNSVVLISDGIESCDGDPCAAAKALADAGINARVHVVGFDVGEDERKQLQCISDMGNGNYYSAANVAELKLAAAEVKEVTIAKAEPVATVWFEDDFDGDDLVDHWELTNPDPDSYIVEEGILTLLAGTKNSGMSDANMLNLITLNKDLPKGDWDVKVTFAAELGSGNDAFEIALRKDENNYLGHFSGIDLPVFRFQTELSRRLKGVKAKIPLAKWSFGSRNSTVLTMTTHLKKCSLKDLLN